MDLWVQQHRIGRTGNLRTYASVMMFKWSNCYYIYTYILCMYFIQYLRRKPLAGCHVSLSYTRWGQRNRWAQSVQYIARRWQHFDL